jgi:transposase
VGYGGRTLPDTLDQRLTGAPTGATGPAADTAAAVTAAFVAVLRTLSAHIEALAACIAEQLDLHPDHAIFTSLPRSGRLRAARLLAEIGDARDRSPAPLPAGRRAAPLRSSDPMLWSSPRTPSWWRLGAGPDGPP